MMVIKCPRHGDPEVADKHNSACAYVTSHGDTCHIDCREVGHTLARWGLGRAMGTPVRWNIHISCPGKDQRKPIQNRGSGNFLSERAYAGLE